MTAQSPQLRPGFLGGIAVRAAIAVPVVLGLGMLSAPHAMAAQVPEVIENTGDSDTPTNPTYVPLVPDVNATAAKVQAIADLRPQVAVMLAGLDPATTPCVTAADTGPGCHAGPPVSKMLSASLFKQETGYTCGPASARTLLAALGVSMSEQALASEMGTTTKGTYWLNLRDTLNRRQNKDHIIGEPEHAAISPDEVMARVMYDIARVPNGYYHPAILNVDQYRFSYWGNTSKVGRHYLTAMGYDTRNQGKIVIGDVAGSHYGLHESSLVETHSAVVGNKGLVLF